MASSPAVTSTGSDDGLVKALRDHQAAQREELKGHGIIQGADTLVFCHPDGRPYHPERFSREFDRVIERHGLRRVRLHDLRHQHATVLLGAGVDMKTVSARLGHSRVGVTLDQYAWATGGMDKDAAARGADELARAREERAKVSDLIVTQA